MSDTNWVDFKVVKDAVSIGMALEHYGIELKKANGTTLRGKCPLPTHVGDSENSFSITLPKNAWACHAGSCVANRAGKKGGNVLDFVAVMEDCTIRDAALKLQNWFSVDASNERPPDYVPSRERKKNGKKLVTEKKEQGSECDSLGQNQDSAPESPNQKTCDTPNKPLEFTLKSVDMSHDYFRRRGIKQATAEHFGTGFFHGKGTMAGRIVIPIHSETGDLIGYAGRAIDDELAKTDGKYKTPFKKSLVLFNLHRVLETKSREVILVEGFFGTMKIHQAGFPFVVAVMGSELYDRQEELLIENFKRVIIIGDGDKSGRDFIGDAIERLSRKRIVRPVCLPDGLQPDQLSSQEIQELLAFM